MLVTFFDVRIGSAGLLAVVGINISAVVFGLHKDSIQQGIYGFNALLLGMGLGYMYQFTAAFWLLFAISVLLLLVITVALNGILEKSKLPFLAFPFLFSFWIITTAAANFTLVVPNNPLTYWSNPALPQHDYFLYSITHILDNVRLPHIVTVYFKTLNGIFFQDTILGGVLISVGLLLHSRISFSLSIIGFISAYSFFKLLGANTDFLSYHLVGSNFIFMAIAIGGFFIVPNIYSYLVVVILTPILIVLLLFINKIVSIIQLSGYTLSFSILVTLFLYFLHQRWLQKYIHLVSIQYYSAEKTIYKHISNVYRFENSYLSKIALPFFDTWHVSQGYEGNITHLGDWSNALDFVITDDQQKTYKNNGASKEDFYCYNKPVLAPADGYVHAIINTVDENNIADVNTQQNWGNTIIIRHHQHLFSQISHIKKDSFKVNVGDFVTKGTAVATCGNSGRSPQPHIHFQLQKTPKVGEKTLTYPIAYFIEHQDKKPVLKISEVPKQDTLISNVDTTPLLNNAFHLVPGKKLKLTDESGESVQWEVFTDAWNRTYLYCEKTLSYAYFTNDDTMFYFYDFEGDKESLLFHFYLAFYRILLGYYQDISIEDQLPLIHFNNKAANLIQDFIAPVYLFTKANYQSHFICADDIHSPEHIEMKSVVTTTIFNTVLKQIAFDILLKNDTIQQFTIIRNNTKSCYSCEYL